MYCHRTEIIFFFCDLIYFLGSFFYVILIILYSNRKTTSRTATEEKPHYACQFVVGNGICEKAILWSGTKIYSIKL